MQGSWLALLPFLIVIPIGFLTRQVQTGLLAGLLLGSYLKEPSLLGGLKTMVSYVVSNIVVPNNIRIIIFLYIFAGIVHMIKMAGGIKGFVNLVSRKIKTPRGALFLTWISTLGTFSNPDLRIVTVGPIMKALRKKLNLTAQKVGLVIEMTSNPVVVIVPVATAFVGYIVAIIADALKTAGVPDAPYAVYLKSIPFNFFSWVILAMGLYYSFLSRSHQARSEGEPAEVRIAGGRTAEPRTGNAEMAEMMAAAGEKPAGNKAVEGDLQGGQEDQALEECHDAYNKETPKKPWNLILPLSMAVILMLFLTWWDGHLKTAGFLDAFLKTDAIGAMLEAIFITLLLTIIFFLIQGISINKIATHFIKGGNELMSVIVLLILIWALSAVSEDLGFSKYIGASMGWIPPVLVAPALFVVGSLISYFIGSSFGTWGLLMPLAVTMAQHSGQSIVLAVGAVLASGTFGGMASPLSDNTVTLCTILDLPLMEYSRWKLIPSLLAAGATTVLYAIASFLMKPAI